MDAQFDTPQASPRFSVPQQQFDFSGHQTGQVTPLAELWKLDSPYDLTAEQNQTSAQGGANQHFHVPPLNTSGLLAMLDSPSIRPSPLSNRIWPSAKFVPIPTQWPNAKFERIPTTWPDLKMEPITASNPSN